MSSLLGGGGSGLTPGSTIITGGTDKAVLFDRAGVLGEDSPHFMWDYTNHRLGIGTNSPSVNLEVRNDAGTDPELRLRSESAGIGAWMEFVNNTGALPNNQFGASDTYFWFAHVGDAAYFQVSDIPGSPGAGFISIGKDGIYSWTDRDAADEVLDGNTTTALHRLSSGVVGVGSAAAGDFSGTVKLTNIDIAGNVTVNSPSSTEFKIGSTNTTGVGFEADATGGGGNNIGFFSTGSTNAQGPGLFTGYDITANNGLFIANNAFWGIGGVFAWNSDATFLTGTFDTGLSRLGPALIGAGNGSAGNTSGTVSLTSLILNATAVAALPGTPVAGQLAAVNNALAPAIGVAVAAGGAAFAAVCWNGAQWTVFSI